MVVGCWLLVVGCWLLIVAVVVRLVQFEQGGYCDADIAGVGLVAR